MTDAEHSLCARAPARLTDAEWEQIASEYLCGATAGEVSARWGVPAQAIYRRARRGGFTKRAFGAQLAAAMRGADERKNVPEITAGGEGDAQTAEGIARAALKAAASAVSEGRANDAKSFAMLAERMRALAQQEREAAAREAAEKRVAPSIEDFIAERWAYIAHVAAAMLRNPAAAPAIFEGRIAEWRRDEFGEGDAESLARARANAAHARAYFEPDYLCAPDGG